MLNPHFGLLAALLPLIGNIGYALDTFKGTAQPNRVSWTLWAISPLIAFAAEVAQGTNFEISLLTFSVGFGPLLVLAASFLSHKAYWKITRFDLACGGISLMALVLWWITDKGDVAIAFSILADLFAAFPTLIKAFKFPGSESANAFVGSAAGGLVALLTIQMGAWNFASAAYPLYIVLVCSFISVLILMPRSKAA